MRLLNTTSLDLADFVSNVPAYAILSHTWLGEEVTFYDLKHRRREASFMKGYRKLEASARIARSEGYQYIWVDTCCIDKSSSAELSEAINSMYQWYKNAALCYAYLADVDTYGSVFSNFSNSRWFTRGWTLQELIAPKRLKFYSTSWIDIGWRDNDDMSTILQDVTGIPRSVLQGGSLSGISAANKMRWASKRKTTRPEDIAYRLLGMFDVNMPLLYGEGGEKAFIRLQEEFLRISDDESIFAWKTGYDLRARPHWGLLAVSPVYFSDRRDLRQPLFKSRIHSHPTSITNRGVRTELSLCPFPYDKSGTIFLAVLRASISMGAVAFAIVLQRLSDVEEEYVRVVPDLLVEINMSLFTIPKERLSLEWRKDFSGLIATYTLQTYDTDTDLNMRVADSESRLIFVRSSPPESELLAGFYLTEEIISNPAASSSVRISRIKHQYPWQEMRQWGLAGYKARPLYMFDFMSSFPDFEALRAENLQARMFICGLEIGLACKNPGSPVIVEKTFSLLMGLEPLPPNPFKTPPQFVKPWYALVAREFDESWVKAVVGLGDMESLKVHSLPNGCTVAARFTTGTRYEQLYYKVEMVVSDS